MTIRQLFPTAVERPLPNLYLDHNLRELARQQKRLFVYANFVMSLDGRIAIADPSNTGFTIPKNVANARDWRMFG